MNLLSNDVLEQMSSSQKKEYYEKLKNECLLYQNDALQIGQTLIHCFYPFFRSYRLEIEGEENIPKDSNALFVVNHSNSHDIFTAYEVLSSFGRSGSVMVATDCLNPITTELFSISNATLLDRRIREDREKSVFSLSKKILDGCDGVIFGESTWNLHPILLMHHIKVGASKIAAITQVPIIPTIFEYIEKEDYFESEDKLFDRCIVRFGKPYMVSYCDSLLEKTEQIRNEMIEMRKDILSSCGIQKDSMQDIDPSLYVNHTYLKKFKAFGFTYDSLKEQEYLLFLDGEAKENEYCLDENNRFVPGITEKKLRKIR